MNTILEVDTLIRIVIGTFAVGFILGIIVGIKVVTYKKK